MSSYLSHPETPLWLLWARVLSVTLSIIGFAVHYYLKTPDRQKLKHAVIRFFLAAARENRLSRVRNAFAAVARGLAAVYGRRVWRLLLTSSLLSLFYFGVTFLACHGADVNWKSIRNTKHHLERTADPALYSLSAKSRARALEETCNEVGLCTYVNPDPEARRIQTQVSAFGQSYSRLVAQDPNHTALTMITIWEGTYVHKDTYSVFLSLLCLNIILDLAGVLLALKVTLLLSRPTSSLFYTIILGIASLAVVLTLSCISVYAYGLVDRGDIWGPFAVLGFAAGVLLVLLGVGSASVRSDSRTVIWVARALGLLFAVGGAIILREASSHFGLLSIPAMRSNDPISWYFYLVALAAMLPSVIAATVILALVAIGTFARTLLTATLVYLRTVIRMPTPLLITLTAAPALVVSAAIEIWPDLPRMLGHH